MKSEIKILIFACLVCCACSRAPQDKGADQAESWPVNISDVKKFATLINKSSENIYFHYHDKLNLINEISIRPEQVYNLEFDSVLYLIQSNKFQNIYKIDKKDTFKLSVNSNGNVIPIDMQDQQQKNEFDLFRYINQHSKYSFMEFNSLSFKMNAYDYKVVDSVVRDRYKEQTALLNSYCKKYPVSERFRNFAEDYFRSTLLASVFSIPVTNKSIIPPSYFDYLNSLEPQVMLQTNKVAAFMSVNLFNSFLRFKMLNLTKGKNQNRSFISEVDSFNINDAAKQHQKVYIIGQMIAVGKQIDTFILRDFIRAYPGTDYSNYYETILADLNTSKTAGDNQLLQIDGKKVEYKDVLASLKGKVVFIDVWASWCMPCRKQFENSKELQKYFSDTPVEFLYISIDNSSTAWKKACIEEGISQKKLNYLLPNHDNSSFVRNLKITSIPRYIVVGKDGKIFNSTLSDEIDEAAKNVILQALK